MNLLTGSMTPEQFQQYQQEQQQAFFRWQQSQVLNREFQDLQHKPTSYQLKTSQITHLNLNKVIRQKGWSQEKNVKKGKKCEDEPPKGRVAVGVRWLPSKTNCLQHGSTISGVNGAELRLKWEAAERAFEAQAEKDRTLMRLEELRSMFKISGNNFNDWFRQLKMVLRVERKLFVIEQPISPAPPTDSEYLRSGMRTKRVKHYLDSTYLWHCHLAHINKKRIEKLQQEGLLKSTDDESFDQCVSCLSGKMTRKSFPHHPERVTDLLGIIHTDVCGPLRHVSRQGASYFITFTDDYSRYGYVYLLKHKHEVFETFKVFKNEVENQLGKTIKAIRSDRGGEYISQEFKDYLKANGIVQQLTPPYTPQHNGVFERRNRTLLDMVRSMMNLTTLPLSFWDYALESATRILNMVPTKKALVKRDTPDKLEQRSVKCIFIGYPKETMGYYFYFSPENKIVVARYAEFFEKRLISQEISGRAVDLEEIQEEEDTTPSEITSYIPQEVEGFEPPQPPQEEVIPIRKFERTHRAPNHLCLNVEVEEHSLGDLNEPTIYKAAMLDSESDKWIDAINAEIQSIMDNMASGSNVTFLILYVDDIIIMGNHIPSLQSVKNYLGKCFSMKDLGEAAFILGIKIYRDRSKRLIGLSQNAYMDKILKRYKMDNSKRGHIPMQERLDLNKSQGAQTPKEVNRMKNVPYASAVGELHWTAVKNILKYLRNTKDMFLVYGENPEAELRVDCYCNAGFEIDINDMKSLTGYVSPALGPIQHRRSNCHSLEFPFQLERDISITQDSCGALHFSHAALIRWVTSSSILPDLCIIEPRYLNDSLGCTILSPIQISTSSLWAITTFLKSHLRYSVFSQLTFRPLTSRVSLQFSSLYSSRIKANRYGLISDPWCSPTSTGKKFMLLIEVSLSLPLLVHKAPNKVNYFNRRSSGHKTKLVLKHRSLSSQPSPDHSLLKLHGVTNKLDAPMVAAHLRITLVFQDRYDVTESPLFRHLHASEG
ncbi:retrotransposon protein, putative, ty1-copia subclass [Tanacetum coccineum]